MPGSLLEREKIKAHFVKVTKSYYGKSQIKIALWRGCQVHKYSIGNCHKNCNIERLPRSIIEKAPKIMKYSQVQLLKRGFMQIALFERLPQSAEECLRAPLSASLQESAPPDLPQGAKSHPTVHLHNHLIRQFTFKNHILKVTKKECKDVPRQKCKFVPKPVCHYVPKEKCDYVPKEQCQLVPTQNCYAVPKQHCVDVPKEECHLVPREQCHKVPREHCETVARPHCEKVAHEVCHPVASQECRSVPGFKRRAFYINLLQSCVLKVFNWP